MAADSDGSGESLTTVVTCEGDLHDPEFPAKFELILDKLRSLLCDGGDSCEREQLCVRKLEPWNSVRVTLAIPRDAALRLRQLANEGSQQLRALGILSVQVEGDQVISLRLAGRFGQEPQEIVLRTGSQDVAGASPQQNITESNNVVSGLTRMLSGGPSSSTQNVATLHQLPSTSAVAALPAEPTVNVTDKVQFRSPNVVCPTDTQVPKVPTAIAPTSATTSGAAQRNYNGPFPFASMTHAAQAIHNRESHSQSAASTHPFTQPPPPYPSQAPPPPPPPQPLKPPVNPNSPNVAMSSPLLVNLLQNDGAQVQSKMSPADQRKLVTTAIPTGAVSVKSSNRLEDHSVINSDLDASSSTNSAFVQTAVTSPVSQTAIKYPQTMTGVNAGIYSVTQTNNSSVPTPNSSLTQSQTNLNSLIPTNSATQQTLGVRPVGTARLPQPFIQQQKVNTQVPVRPLVQPNQPLQTTTAAITQPTQMRPIRPPVPPNQKFPPTGGQSTVTAAGNVQFSTQFPRQNFRGQLGQFAQQPSPQVQQQQPSFQQNFQQFPSPPPYPRQRLDTPRPSYQDISRFQQQRIQQSGWQQSNQFQQLDANVTPVGQPMPSLSGISQINNQNLQPIAQPMPHLGSLSAVLDNSLSNITPSLTDLSKTDLDSLLPSLEGELGSTPDIPDIPESLTSTGKRRQYLINPLTGVLEPMPSDSSGSESENEEGKETTDIFNDFNSPLNDRSNSIYSDEDTSSTTISRKLDTTDQSDSEATVRSSNSETSVKSHQRIKSGKNRDRNRDSPGLKKNIKDLPTEKIKLRLKLEKSEPVVSPAYKVDISFINTQQPKRATQNVARPALPPAPSMPCTTTPPASEELRVPPLHISLRGRNSVVINSEKKKKYSKLNPDGTTAEVKKSKKTIDGLKVKKSLSAKELSVKNSSLLPTLSKSESSLTGQKVALIKSGELTVPSTSTSTLEQKLTSEMKMTNDILKSDNKTIKSFKNSDVDDLPLKHRMREPGEILTSSKPVKPVIGDMKKSKKSNKFNHLDLYREQNLLTGGHIVDDFKSHKKLKSDEKSPLKYPHKTSEHSNKINSHFKKEKFKDKMVKDRLPGHVGEIRRGSDSDVGKCLKRHADSNGLSHIEKKRRLSQSEGKMNIPTLTESQGVNKSVKLKSSPSDGHISSSLSQTSTTTVQSVVGSTNVGTISSIANKTISSSKSSSGSKLQKSITKVKRDKVTSFVKTKEGSFKSKDLNRDKTYSQNVAEKLAKQLPTIGEIDMEAKFKQSLLESSTDVPRRHTQSERKTLDSQKLSDAQMQLDRVTELVQTLSDRADSNSKPIDFSEKQKSGESVVVGTRESSTESANKGSPDRKSTETDLPQTQRLDDKQSGRSPNSGGQGEDSGIESMDALSEKSPNQASQSPHSHTEITLTDSTVTISEIKTVKSETKLENCLTDLMDIEEQLAKMDGLPTLNGDINHMIKTEPFMKTETLIEKLEGTEGKDLNENKEHTKEAILDECCGSISDLKVQTTTDCKIDIGNLPLTAAMQENLKQGNISVTSRSGDFVSNSKENETKDKIHPELEISLVTRKFNCDDQKIIQKAEIDNKSIESSLKEESSSKPDKDLDFDPLPIRRKPPLYTYSNPEKQSRDSDSPLPNLSDLESENSDSNSEFSEVKSKISQKATTVTRRRKQNLDNIPLNDIELDACIEAMNSGHYLAELTGFKKNDIVKKTPKSLLEQLLIEIPSEISDKQVSSTSPSVSEKSLNTSKSSIRTRSSSKLNSPDISETSKSEKSLKTPRHSPVILKQDSPANSPVLSSSKASPKCNKVTLGSLPVKRKRQESESSTQSNVSIDEMGNNIRNKKVRKCSENAVELIKACMGVDHSSESLTIATANVTNNKTITQKSAVVKELKKPVDKNKLGTGLLRKSQLADLESSDSDEPLIEIAGKVRNKHVATRNKLNSTKSNITTPLKSVPVVGKGSTVVGEEKTVGTRRSVRNNAAIAGIPSSVGTSSNAASLKTRSKLQQQLMGDKPAGSGVTITGTSTGSDNDANRRKTRSAVSDDGKRRRNSRDGK